MNTNTVSASKAKERKSFDWKRVILLAVLLVSIVFLVLEAVDRAHTVAWHDTFDLLFWVLWAVLRQMPSCTWSAL